jgi:plastocyanin
VRIWNTKISLLVSTAALLTWTGCGAGGSPGSSAGIPSLQKQTIIDPTSSGDSNSVKQSSIQNGTQLDRTGSLGGGPEQPAPTPAPTATPIQGPEQPAPSPTPEQPVPMPTAVPAPEKPTPAPTPMPSPTPVQGPAQPAPSPGQSPAPAPGQGSAPAPTPAQGMTNVSATNMNRFAPAAINIHVGDTVTWTNNSRVVRSVTFDPSKARHPEHAVLPAGVAPFDSDAIAPKGKFSHTFTVPGLYTYFSRAHEAQGMIGSINVIP